MKGSSDFLDHIQGSSGVQTKLSSASSADALVKMANDAGFQVDKNSLSTAMRDMATAEFRKRGLPDWAINSVLLGDAVCW